jgi:hypothetical protein
MLSIPLCLDNRFIDGGKVVSSTQRPRFTPQKHYFFFMFQVLISVKGRLNPKAQGVWKDYVSLKNSFFNQKYCAP